MGKIASSLIEEGVKLGVSSRGVGSLQQTKEGFAVVGEDFMLATADIVADPRSDAFVEGIMEGKSGYGMLVYFVRSLQLKHINRLTL